MTKPIAEPAKKVVLAISGASGAIYAHRLLNALVQKECKVYLTISKPAALVLQHELKLSVDLNHFSVEQILGRPAPQVSYYHYDDISAPIASGTFPIDCMAIVPCSMSTLAAVAGGLAHTLILRAAEVTLKERRPLILVARETPLGIIEIENMLKAARAGACILPAAHAFYHNPQALNELVDYITSKILSQLGIEHDKHVWGEGA